MAIYKVKSDTLVEIKKVLLSYSDINSLQEIKNGSLVSFLNKRKTKAKKLIKLLEEEYYV
jgi:hypothetical protein